MIQVKEMETLVNTNHEILSHHCGQPIEKIVADTSRDYFMSPTEAKEYGIIDAVYSATGNPLAALSQPADGADGVDKADGGQQPPEAELDRG
jgi:ATP-dependent Clp protease protease subunit